MPTSVQPRLPTPSEESMEKRTIKPVVIAAILGLILTFQLGLVIWVYLKQF